MYVSSCELDLISLVLQKVHRFHLYPTLNLHMRSFFTVYVTGSQSGGVPGPAVSASPENLLEFDPGTALIN